MLVGRYEVNVTQFLVVSLSMDEALLKNISDASADCSTLEFWLCAEAPGTCQTPFQLKELATAAFASALSILASDIYPVDDLPAQRRQPVPTPPRSRFL